MTILTRAHWAERPNTREIPHADYMYNTLAPLPSILPPQPEFVDLEPMDTSGLGYNTQKIMIDPDIAQLWQQFCINYEDSVARLVAAALPDLTAADMDAAVRTIAGSARSMGLEVEGL